MSSTITLNSAQMSHRIHEFTENYFSTKNNSWLESALKVASYVTLIIPTLVLITRAVLRSIYKLPSLQVLTPVKVSESLQKIINNAPKFNSYRIGANTRFARTPLMAPDVRPANLFLDEVLGSGSTTMPQTGSTAKLFAITKDHNQVRKDILNANPNQTIEVTAKGKQGTVKGQQIQLDELYGNATYKMSYKELQDTLESQKIHVAPKCPVEFYEALKSAMLKDGIVILPNSRPPLLVKTLNTYECSELLKDATRHPQKYGFKNRPHLDLIRNLTLYQLGALVVKTENFRILIDSDGKIKDREPGEKDALRLINACGIRQIYPIRFNKHNRPILTETFGTVIRSAQNGILVMSAVGMGVWKGDPNLYWRALLDAVINEANNIEKILVNPGHQKTEHGTYKGNSGQEFQIILNEYKTKYAGDPKKSANLQKVINLFESKADIVHLSQDLKKAYPNKIISLLNASDPDVTLGYHVGEYVNRITEFNHATNRYDRTCTTTEENFTALGTNGLCFETITGVHEEPGRVVQAKLSK